MRILFHLGHPAHFHLFKNVISGLVSIGYQTDVLIKKKDILEELLKHSGIVYKNILPGGRADNILSIGIGLIKQDYELLRYSIRRKVRLLVGTSASIAHVGKILNIPSMVVNEDDAAVVPLFSKLAYPLATKIVSPDVCHNGKWDYKTIKYNSYHELAYLHPENFVPDESVINKYKLSVPYFLIRFVKLGAHHDTGISGISDDIALKIINKLKSFGRVVISSEKSLTADLEKYRLNINPIDIHNVMAFSSIYIGDSQTMAAESGVLGVPFIRYNDFVGKIGYLDELENKYCLGFGITSNEEAKLYNTVERLLNTANLKEIYKDRLDRMLADKIELSKYLIRQISSTVNNKLL